MNLKELVTQGARNVRNAAGIAAIGAASLLSAQDAQAQQAAGYTFLCPTSQIDAPGTIQRTGPHTQPAQIQILIDGKWTPYATLREGRSGFATAFSDDGQQVPLPAERVQFILQNADHRLNLGEAQEVLTDRTPTTRIYDFSQLQNPDRIAPHPQGEIRQWQLGPDQAYVGLAQNNQFVSSSRVCLDIAKIASPVDTTTIQEPEPDTTQQNPNQGKPPRDRQKPSKPSDTVPWSLYMQAGPIVQVGKGTTINNEGIPENRTMTERMQVGGIQGRINYHTPEADLTITGRHQTGTASQEAAGFIVDLDLSKTEVDVRFARALQDNFGVGANYSFIKDTNSNVRLRGDNASGLNDGSRTLHAATAGPVYARNGFVMEAGVGGFTRSKDNIREAPDQQGIAFSGGMRYHQDRGLDWKDASLRGVLDVNMLSAGEELTRIAAQAGVDIHFKNIGVHGGLSYIRDSKSTDALDAGIGGPRLNLGVSYRLGNK